MMSEVPEAGESLTHIKSAFDMFRSAIGLVRDVGEMVPEENKEAVSAALVKAERTARLAEAQIAQALGYKLCQCTFPPQIMLSIGYRDHNEARRCPACGKEWPGPRPPVSRVRPTQFTEMIRGRAARLRQIF